MIVPPPEYPGKRYRNRYAYEHIVNYWLKTGTVPVAGMEIHHRNGNHRDNRIENLQLVTAQEHRRLHAEMKKVPDVIIICAMCGKEKAMRGRNKKYKESQGMKMFFCSISCGATMQHKLGGRLR